MKLRQTQPIEVAAAKADFSCSTGFRIAQDPRLPSQKMQTRERRRPDPLETIFDAEVVPLLKDAPGLRPVAIFEEMLRAPSRAFAGDTTHARAPDPVLARAARG